MNINDYTYHICDRFVLLFIAFIGLAGTSYILVSGGLDCQESSYNGITNDYYPTSFNQAINCDWISTLKQPVHPKEPEDINNSIGSTKPINAEMISFNSSR